MTRLKATQTPVDKTDEVAARPKNNRGRKAGQPPTPRTALQKCIWQKEQFVARTSELTGRTVYENQSHDQYLISPAWNQAAVQVVVAEWNARIYALPGSNRPPAGQRAAVAALSDCVSPQAFGEGLNVLLLQEFKAKLDNEGFHFSGQQFLTQLMLAMWCKGLVAWPLTVQEPFPSAILTLNNAGWSAEFVVVLNYVRKYLARDTLTDAVTFRFFVDMVLSRAGVVELGDITPTTMQVQPAPTRKRKQRPMAFTGLLQALRDEYSIKQVPWVLEDFGFYQARSGHLRRKENFEWALEIDPTMIEWVELAKQHLAENPTNYRKRRSAVNVFIEHIAKNSTVNRSPAGYCDIKRRPDPLFHIDGNKGRQTMVVVYQFLNEVLHKVCIQADDNAFPILMPGFANPLVKQTFIGVNKGETHRESMPTRLIRQAMSILTENDFAWAREVGKLSDNFRWKNPETREFESVWSPVRTYALMAKLILPARTYQIRHLDSSEGDSLRYEENGTWGPNTGKHAPSNAGVERGVFRQYKRKDGSLGAVLYFNTNKTGDIDKDKDKTGFVMPWEKLDALQLFARMRNWQEKYNQLDGPTNWTDINELKAAKHVEDLRKLGTNLFLFRDPCHQHRPDLPVSDVRLRNLWLRLMEELEKRLALAGETLANGEPIKLVISSTKRSAPSAALFDLHTLRVTMITAMYEEGIPPEILMKIVGHASIIMTLYYVKLNAETISVQLDAAVQERQRKEQSEMAGFIQRASRMELERAVARTHPSALDAITSGTGTGLVVMDHGVCPVAARRCHEGLASMDPSSGFIRYLAVPGGASNCVRCRFFVSGPAFLLGLEAHVIDLSYRLRKASVSFEKSQLRFDALSNQFADALENVTPFSQQRDLEIAETALESVTAEVDAIALSLQCAYALTEQSIHINNLGVNKPGGSGLSLVAVGGTGELEAVLTETHEFEQLHRICESAMLFDGLKIDWQHPNLERARLFDRMLRASGCEPHFSLLDDEDALGAANAMGKFLYARLGPKTVHDLMDGRTTLRALGMEKAFADQLQAMTPKSLALSRTIFIEGNSS
ncbi:gamma-mobile-trio integrase GmtZ [Polaromonas naphthalenivorans]|uniref:Phage integrase family protein n=1 Tax=Polaromonas naphthalenivorans (strain CJ2) TaxID=365044 RepID=A1VJW9_POLNA|nr:VPA1269 family protein [Polaromonas naphthalenivorans]ABM35947.1 phage integrase family protein [Polaromonas naphthalenivorans CJ2]ABM39656.1 phage integrase family protein [Polaromonas naphthalenivorans CJ2]